jgi:putative heme-binding domain-containing protein
VDQSCSPKLRAEAICGLSAVSDQHLPLLLQLSAHASATIREEALRAVRLTVLSEEQEQTLHGIRKQFPESAALVDVILEPGAAIAKRPPLDDLIRWQQMLARQKSEPDSEAGERIFFHPRLAQCSTCHQRSGRGNIVGPDLSAVGERADEAWLLQAILEPSRDVAPQFYAVTLDMKDGSTFVGFPLRDGGGASAVFRDLTGAERSINRPDIVSRTELQSSVMPAGLLAMLTDREIRDLLAFLRRRGADR